MAQNQINVLQAELKFRGYKFTKEQVKELIDAISDTFLDFARNGEDFHIPHVGTFEIRTHKARILETPLTDQPMHLGERRRVKFVPSNTLKRTAEQSINAKVIADEEET